MTLTEIVEHVGILAIVLGILWTLAALVDGVLIGIGLIVIGILVVLVPWWVSS